MPERLPDKVIFSLGEVAKSIQRTLAERYKQSYWIKAEMNKLNHYAHSGHCYPELVEKRNGKVVAEMRAILWNGDYQRINQRFIEVMREPLKSGIAILFLTAISYDPLYGLSLRIIDIDPSYSLGELEREKLESIHRLKTEGLFERNKRLPFPIVPKRLAIISVETSKGYADFLKIINGNPWRYRFEHTLFPALLQGDRSIPSILNQLVQVAEQMEHYDVVAIIRGGGGDVGLSSYNSYLLASAIAQFPIPVLTGIGHSTNETVAEMVAYQNAITPSELADFLIQRFHQFAAPLAQAQEVMVSQTRRLLAAQRELLSNRARHFRVYAIQLLKQQRSTLEHHFFRLGLASNHCLQQNSQMLRYACKTLQTATATMCKERRALVTSMEKSTRLLDPQQVLNRGYSITRLNGRALTAASRVKPGDLLETVLASGKLNSIVMASKKAEHE